MAKDIGAAKAVQIAKEFMQRDPHIPALHKTDVSRGSINYVVTLEGGSPKPEKWEVKVKRTNGEIGPCKQV